MMYHLSSSSSRFVPCQFAYERVNLLETAPGGPSQTRQIPGGATAPSISLLGGLAAGRWPLAPMHVNYDFPYFRRLAHFKLG
jgi:hypothetical protein